MGKASMWQLVADICRAGTINCRQPRTTRSQIEPSKIAGSSRWHGKGSLLVFGWISSRHDGSLLEDRVGQWLLLVFEPHALSTIIKIIVVRLAGWWLAFEFHFGLDEWYYSWLVELLVDHWLFDSVGSWLNQGGVVGCVKNVLRESSEIWNCEFLEFIQLF